MIEETFERSIPFLGPRQHARSNSSLGGACVLEFDRSAAAIGSCKRAQMRINDQGRRVHQDPPAWDWSSSSPWMEVARASKAEDGMPDPVRCPVIVGFLNQRASSTKSRDRLIVWRRASLSRAMIRSSDAIASAALSAQVTLARTLRGRADEPGYDAFPAFTDPRSFHLDRVESWVQCRRGGWMWPPR